jgi:BolA protein
MSEPITADRVEAALRAAISPLEALEVIDESHRHAGHAGAGVGTHWRVRLVSSALTGLGRVARHRLVYDALRPLIEQGIHALAIEARAPAEA